MRRRLIMTRSGQVRPAQMKVSATPAYTVDELREKVGKYHKLIAEPREGLTERLYLNGFLDWIENPEEFTGE